MRADKKCNFMDFEKEDEAGKRFCLIFYEETEYDVNRYYQLTDDQ